MTDEIKKGPVPNPAAINTVNGKGGANVYIYGDDIGAPGREYPDNPGVKSTLGCVKAGTNITIAADGTISASGGGSTDWSQITNKPATFTPPIATAAVVGGVKQGTNITIGADGTISAAGGTIVPATPTVLGGIKVGTGLNVTGDGTLSTQDAVPDWNSIINKPATFPVAIASASQLGGVKEGAGINIEPDGTISTVSAAPEWNEILNKPASFPPPVAATNVLGGVKQGNGVSIAPDGTLSANIQQVDWDIIVDKPIAYPPTIASETEVGGVKAGNNISIDPDGTINAAAVDLPIASTYLLGGVKIGAGISVAEDGTIGTEASAPYWLDIVDKPKAFPPTNASEGVVGGIMPDSNFSIAPDGMISAKPFTGQPFAAVVYDGYGKIAASTTASFINGNLVLGGVAPVVKEDGTLGETVSFGGQITLLDQTGAYRAAIKNDSFDYTLLLTNGPNVKAGFMPFVTQVDNVDVSVAFGPIQDAIGYTTKAKLGVVQVGNNIDVDAKGVVSVKTTSKSDLGLVKIGGGLDVDANGLVTPSLATTATPGIVQIGKGLEVDANGVINTTDAVGFLNRRVFENNTYYEKDYDWTLPEGVEYFRVTVVGGGGTGGGWSNNANEGSGGAGGGGGAYSRAMFYGYKFKAGDAFKVRVGCSNYKGLGDGTESYFRLASKASSYLYCEGGKGGESGYVQGSEKKGFTKPGDGGVVKTDGFDGAVMFNLDAVSGGNGLPGLSVTTPHGPKTVGGAGGSSFLGTSGGTFPTSGYGTGAGGAGEANNSGGGGGGYVGRGGVVIIEY